LLQFLPRVWKFRLDVGRELTNQHRLRGVIPSEWCDGDGPMTRHPTPRNPSYAGPNPVRGTPEMVKRIKELIGQHAIGPIEAHDVRTRHAGRMTFIEFHLVVPGDTRGAEAHEICDRIETALKDDMEGEASLPFMFNPKPKPSYVEYRRFDSKRLNKNNRRASRVCCDVLMTSPKFERTCRWSSGKFPRLTDNRTSLKRAHVSDR
jgi:hypothetical protein